MVKEALIAFFKERLAQGAVYRRAHLFVQIVPRQLFREKHFWCRHAEARRDVFRRGNAYVARAAVFVYIAEGEKVIVSQHLQRLFFREYARRYSLGKVEADFTFLAKIQYAPQVIDKVREIGRAYIYIIVRTVGNSQGDVHAFQLLFLYQFEAFCKVCIRLYDVKSGYDIYAALLCPLYVFAEDAHIFRVLPQRFGDVESQAFNAIGLPLGEA